MGYNYIPKYIRQSENKSPKSVVTASRWNELFNLLIQQGDHTAEELGNILNYFSTVLVGVESEIAESAEAIANIRGTFRINVTSSNGVYSSDKTFAEIRAAYDAGQQPFVVLTGGTFDLVYTLANFEAPTDGSEPKFVDFARYLVGDGILKTETLRIYSYTTDSGSNVVKRIDEFKMPTSLKNPNALTFTDGATGSYDGSTPMTVKIPTAPTKTSQLTNDSGFLTSHQDISGKQDKATLEADVAAKGFTKNTGTYSKPADGIPKSDLAAAVQTSLDKADSALQHVPSAYRTAVLQDKIDSGKVDKVDGKGLSTNDYTDAAKAKVDALALVATSGSYNDLTNKPTIPAAPTKTSQLTNDSGYLTLETLPKYGGESV